MTAPRTRSRRSWAHDPALAFIRRFQGENDGLSPNMSEIASAVGYRSVASGFQVVVDLEDMGLIRRAPGRHRAIEIVGDPA